MSVDEALELFYQLEESDSDDDDLFVAAKGAESESPPDTR